VADISIQRTVGVCRVKIDEVQGSPEVPQVRSQDVVRQSELQRQAVQQVTPPDQVELSSSARQMGSRDVAARAASLKSELNSAAIDPQAVAVSLLKDGVLP